MSEKAIGVKGNSMKTIQLDWIDVIEYELEWEDGFFRVVEPNGDVAAFGETVSDCISKLYSNAVAIALHKQELEEL